MGYGERDGERKRTEERLKERHEKKREREKNEFSKFSKSFTVTQRQTNEKRASI